MNELSTHQLREALQLSEQIDSLRQRLHSLIGRAELAPAAVAKVKEPTRRARRGKRTMSPEGRARIAAAAKARWAKLRGSAEPAATPAKGRVKKKRTITPEGRAKIAAAMKARWAARKSGKAS